MLYRSIAVLLLLSLLGANAPDDPIGAVRTRTVDGIRLRTLDVDLADPRVRVSIQTARGFPHGSEDFRTLVARARPVVAINGAYFSKQTYAPIGDVVIAGKIVHRGLMGTALAITRRNEVTIRRVRPDRTEDWSRYETVLACGPALVLDRRIDVDPAFERFHDPHVMRAARRMGIAMLLDRRLTIVTTADPVTFAQWARVMYDLGATDAMNLDAGASLAMYVRGKTLLAPSRKLTTILTIRTSSFRP